VIGVRHDATAQRRRRAAHDEAVGQLVDVGAERAQVADDDGDPVALLDAQLLGAGDARLALRVGGETRDEGQLVDQRRNRLATDRDAAQRTPALHPNVGDPLAGELLPIEQLDVRSHLSERGEESCARLVDAHAALATARRRGASAASAAKNAADEGSPGTVTSSGASRVAGCSRTDSSFTQTSTPCEASMRSV
jgi:hypothetical protein